MSFKINQGLFQLGITDNHAILGIKIDADFNAIRKQYMRIARRLHPDTSAFQETEDKELGKELLAKLVSPAYNKFSKDDEKREYELLINTIADRIKKDPNSIEISTEAAKQLQTIGDFNQAYETSLQELVEQQYESPKQALARIGEISELNLVYLMRSRSGNVVATPTPPPRPVKTSFVDKACDRAVQLMETSNYAKAILELKDAVKREPSHPRCHGLLGLIYIKQNQPKLGTPHIRKALSIDPNQPEAIEAQQLIQKTATTSSVKGKSKKSGSGSGGLLGRLFGGSKKK
ncbi:J domain-containing protein [Arthrospira platensis]|mgnify:CR=1 FL=1|jgi:curved DNA-binding protein CbpA|uniref:DnaJ domain protein n=1 Tax=Limnospira platensis NIES-46 TaxID=1236695 RepID=A0A5M3T9K6_LIMPL|nr:DnaJ domain-containing protein [Arthrospira platensis]AMW28439.1 molecular chaperone DnaJ [Arthrospira platensis YZ]KDR56379.1 molecular chaperone DnaJ [Arthrospira platensis str. Paraca]MBD2670581.1 DnaJ domain-containing protein [Arthrospira platensis FACHB-439]MBD2711241.1 DnaJ domain-containing protein [Arthrospira platensis FACHB-835]MDT9311532.1 DnaJ domain-containing protein [Limnospira sp. Paracas R14]QQW31234.1 DnaJ domain-containing protein [Arthrospira sp. PCC 9108]